MQQIVVYPKDVAALRGTSYHAAWRLLAHLRATLGKHPGADISAREFATYSGLPEDEVLAAINHR